jgi:diaminohydroxyphosphoribosylaminopyrimidine deaminase/5-amino-6-(5-phosphoribosylamino)uracil reductase
MLLGAGPSAVGDLGAATLTDALHLEVVDVTTLGTGADTNVRLTLTPLKETV